MENQTSQSGYGNGQNFAPIKPFLDLKDNQIPEKSITDHQLVRELRSKYNELIQRDKQSWREMVCAGQLIALFIEGEQILRINHANGMPQIDKPKKFDPMHIKCINKMRLLSTMWQHKWRSSKPDILLSPFANTDQAIAQVRKANAVVDYLERSFFNTWFDLQEGLNAQIWGWYGRRVKPDHSSKQNHTFKEILGEKEFEIGKATGNCECGYKGDKSKKKTIGKKTFHACPKCDSLEYDFEPPITQIMKVPVKREKVFLPEIICEPLVFASTRFDLSRKAEDSSWLITEKNIEESSLRRIIGNIRLPEGESGNDFGLDTIDFLAQRGSAINGQSDVSNRAKQVKRITLTEMYLSADDLYDIKVGGEEKTVEGETLKKGARMSDLFPHGCHVVGINGLSLILGIYKAHHSQCITSGVYHMKAMSGAGQGVTDAIEPQKQYNRRYSQMDNHIAKRATPPIMMIENGVENRYLKLMSNPGAVIPVKLQNFPEIKDVRQLIAPIQGESVPNDLVGTLQNLDEVMKTSYHITSFGGLNSQGVAQDTATYWQINDSNADDVFSPVLSIKAEATVGTVKKGFYMWAELTPEARFIPFKSQSKSGSHGIEIKGSDIDAEYNWSWTPGSEAPKSKFTETQKRMQFFSQFQGGISGWVMARQQFPKELAEIERDFDVNFETDNFDHVGEACRLRYERAKAKLAKGQDYLEILINLKPLMLPTEPNLGAQALWFANLLLTEEGLEMSNEERELVSTFILTIKKLEQGQSIFEQQLAAEAQVKGQQPIIDAQNEQAAAQQEQQMAAQQAQAQAEQGANQDAMIGEGLQTVAQGISQEQQQAHEQEQQDNEHAIRGAEMIQSQVEAEQQRQHELELSKQQGAKNANN